MVDLRSRTSPLMVLAARHLALVDRKIIHSQHCDILLCPILVSAVRDLPGPGVSGLNVVAV